MSRLPAVKTRTVWYLVSANFNLNIWGIGKKHILETDSLFSAKLKEMTKARLISKRIKCQQVVGIDNTL